MNTVSAQYPTNSSGECLTKDGSCGYAFRDWKASDYEKGIWNVMPVVPYDHIAIVGGVFNSNMTNTRTLYLDIVQNIVGTYGGTAEDPCISGTLFRFVDGTVWTQVFRMLRNCSELISSFLGR